MRCPSPRSLLVAAAGAAAVAIAAPLCAAPIEIAHQPVSCVPVDRYLHVTARGVPAGEVASAELQFRAGGTEWYAVRMASDAGTWSAYLPRPTARLARIEYRIAMAGADSAMATSGPHVVPVSAECAAAESTVEVASPILVRVPKDAPVVPPVPVGFSPAGVLLANAPAPKPPSKAKGAALLAGGAALAGGAVAATRGGEHGEPAELPTFDYFSTFITPSSGNVITLGTSELSAVVTVRGGRLVPLIAIWRLELLRGGDECAFAADVTELAPTRPLGVFLTAPVRATGGCGPSFEVQNGRLTIVVEGQMVYDRTLPMTFRVVTP